MFRKNSLYEFETAGDLAFCKVCRETSKKGGSSK
jgi:hypothetical protein